MPRKPKTPTITNEQIHQLMLDGLIEVVDGITEPRLVCRGRELKPYYNEQGGRSRLAGSCRWRYTLRFNGARRSILRSTIVWIWYFGPVSPDHNVHHGDAGKDVDAVWNLCALTVDEHARLHYGDCDCQEGF